MNEQPQSQDFAKLGDELVEATARENRQLRGRKLDPCATCDDKLTASTLHECGYCGDEGAAYRVGAGWFCQAYHAAMWEARTMERSRVVAFLRDVPYGDIPTAGATICLDLASDIERGTHHGE